MLDSQKPRPTSLPSPDAARAGRTGPDRPSGIWVRPLLTPVERAAELAAIERQVVRDRRRDLALAALEGAVSLGVALYLIGWAFHTTDQGLGSVALLAGVALGNAGLLLTLVRAHARAAGRGEL